MRHVRENNPAITPFYDLCKPIVLGKCSLNNTIIPKFIFGLSLIFFTVYRLSAQGTLHPDTLNNNSRQFNSSLVRQSVGKLTQKQLNNRVKIMTLSNIAGYGGSLILLNESWYKNYPRASFHTFNDIREWQQVDKFGHSWAAYNTGKVSTAMWRWAGLPQNKSAIIGGLSGALYLTVIEFLDGHSSEWGWSWGDIGANFFGSGLFLSQELLWQKQRIQYKFSFHNKKYGDPELSNRANALFGTNWYERMLKDYNGQTYWLSANIKSFFQDTKLPEWLNVAVGYGAEGMLGGFDNTWKQNGVVVNRMDIKRYHQWYLAPDIDLTKISTSKKGVKLLLQFLNSFKFPMPSLEFSNGKFRVNMISF
jgi:hypothetical protein